MKISKVRLKNCLGIEELEFEPGNVAHITGGSGAGKTSVLESISQFLTNKGERPEFVHKGAEKGEVFIEFDNGLKGKKVFKPDGKASSVSLERDGMRPKGAETFLKSLFNPQQINPIEFISKSPKEQTEIILNAVPMELSAEDIEAYFGENLAPMMEGQHALKICKALEEAYFEKRKESNSQIKYFKNDIEVLESQVPPDYDAEKWRSTSLSDFAKQMNDAAEHNKYYANCQRLISDAESKKMLVDEKCNSDIAILEERIAQLQRDIEATKERASVEKAAIDNKVLQAKEWLSGKEEIDISPLQTEMETAEKMKALVALADDLTKKRGWLENEILRNADYENKLATARMLPQQLIKSANFPVEDMAINELGEITVKGLPIKNLSGAQRLEFAISIAKLTCGELKTILVNGFEALDTTKKKQFLEAARNDSEFQYIIAEVTDNDLLIQ